MGRQIDLNCDLGESYGSFQVGADEQVIALVSSVNIACGWHAGDPMTIEKTVGLAKRHGVGLGAHPGLPDLMGFGRRHLHISPEEACAYVRYQLGAVSAFAQAACIPIQHLKPHGALYNMAAVDYPLAAGICRAVASFDPDLILLALSGSEMVRAAKAHGLRVASEVFADRAYQSDGTLAPRSMPGSVIEDEEAAVRRALQMAAEGTVESITGEVIPIRADSICIHGDSPHALRLARRIRSALAGHGIRVSSLREVLS